VSDDAEIDEDRNIARRSSSGEASRLEQIGRTTREVDRQLGLEFRRERTRRLDQAALGIDRELGRTFADERDRRLTEAARESAAAADDRPSEP
jgi:hypothetical protein